mmetsp:Transcript_118296/g.264172  ORF Transcript_118296/g.264172 Transcript_118296/m.264172 type:complete len:130 (-) Transcript_118296:110-499(-)
MLARHLASKRLPILWVVGHFHTNVNQDYIYEDESHGKLTMSIVVTSSSGSPMWWDGAHGDGHLSAPEAQAVASKPIGAAFFEDIMDRNPGGPWPSRIQPSPQRSGMLVISMFTDGTFKHEWKTLEALQR